MTRAECIDPVHSIYIGTSLDFLGGSGTIMGGTGGRRGLAGLASELREIARRGRDVWRIVPRGRKLSLAGAVVVMGVASLAATAIRSGLGLLVNSINPETHRGVPRAELGRSAGKFLLLIGLAYLVRESLGVLRRYLVERTCTRIDRDLS